MNYGRFRIIEERGELKKLGRGSMGDVYLAVDPQLDCRVALKVLKKKLVIDENIFQRFIQEAQITRRVAHGNIVTVYEMGRDHGTIYIAMEFVEGKSLDKVIKENELTHKEILSIGDKIAEALDYAHKQNVIHRDIKPENIMCTFSGKDKIEKIKITDFGIARIDEPIAIQRTLPGTLMGTVPYMSPEQTRAQPLDGRSDLFSLGVVLYELIAGEKPFKGENIQAVFDSIRQDEPKPLHKENDAIPRCLSELVLKSLKKNPNRRFQTGAEMKASIEKCIAEIKGNGINWIKILKRSAIFLIIAIVVSVFSYMFWLRYHSAVVKVNSTPVGAQVFIDGKFRGKTGTMPFEIKLPFGNYVIELVPDNNKYKEWTVLLPLDERGEKTVSAELKPIKENRS